jgi:hypothetical protein
MMRAGFEVSTAVAMKNAVFKGRGSMWADSVIQLLTLFFFYSEERRYSFLRNSGFYKTHTAPHTRGRHFSVMLLVCCLRGLMLDLEHGGSVSFETLILGFSILLRVYQ